MLGDFLRQNPSYLISKYSDLFTYTLEHQSAQPLVRDISSLKELKHLSKLLLQVSLVAIFALNDDLKFSGKCRLTISKKLPVTQTTSYIYPKNSRLKSLLDIQLILLITFQWRRVIQLLITRLQRFWEYGLMDKIRQNYQPRIDKCLIGSNKPRIEVLTLRDLSSAFVLFGIGISASFVAFIIEALSSYNWSNLGRIVRHASAWCNKLKTKEGRVKNINKNRCNFKTRPN